MKLNEAKAICIGEKPVKTVCLGEQQIWPEEVSGGLTDYFDCRYGLTTASWKNQAAGGNDIVFSGSPEIMEDGSIGLRDSAKDFGSLLSPYTENRTIYCLFRTERFSFFRDNAYILGSANSGNKISGHYVALYSSGVDETNLMIGADRYGMVVQSDVLSTMYHVAAIRITQVTDSEYLTELFVDGMRSGEMTSATPYGDLIGIGTFLYPDGSSGNSQNVLKQIRTLAVYSVPHSDAEIREISEQMLDYGAEVHAFRMEISGMRGANSYMQFAEFTLYDENREKIGYYGGGVCTASWTPANYTQNAAVLIDGDPTTTMCLFRGSGSCEIRIDAALPKGRTPAFYSITTGGDLPERDPVSWKLYYRAPDGGEFLPADEQENAAESVPTGRNTESTLFPLHTFHSFMPVMDGITDYFDSRDGLTGTEWFNQTGGNSIVFTGMEIQPDGAAMVTGTAESYGKVIPVYDSGKKHTVYAVFKAAAAGEHVFSIGNGLGTNAPFSAIGVDGETHHFACFVKNMVTQSTDASASGISGENYHVAAWVRSPEDTESRDFMTFMLNTGDCGGISVIAEDRRVSLSGTSEESQELVMLQGNFGHASANGFRIECRGRNLQDSGIQVRIVYSAADGEEIDAELTEDGIAFEPSVMGRFVKVYLVIPAGVELAVEDLEIVIVDHEGMIRDTLYIDGNKAADAVPNTWSLGSCWGIGLILNPAGEIQGSGNAEQHFRMLAFGTQAHSAEQVAENSAWLKRTILKEE